MSDQPEVNTSDFKSFIFSNILNKATLLFWVIVIVGSLAGLGVSYYWYENSRQNAIDQNSELCEKIVSFQSRTVEDRLEVIEMGLLDIRNSLSEDFDKGRRREELGLVKQGNVWHRAGSNKESEILILAEATNALGRGAVAMSGYFDNLSRQLINADPAVDGVVFYSMSGVIRRLPGNGFTQRLGKDERWRGLKLVQESRILKGIGVKWIEGAELSQLSDGPAQTVLTTIEYENAISTVLACELNCNELIPYRSVINNGWIAMFDRTTRLIAADSTGKQFIGSARIPIIDHRDPNISLLGKRIQRSDSGNGIINIKGVAHHYAYKKIPSTGWTVVSTLPIINAQQQKQMVGKVILSSLIIPVVLILITILLQLHYRNHLAKLGENSSAAILGLYTDIEKIGRDASLPKTTKDTFEEWEKLTIAVRECARRTKASDPELPAKVKQYEAIFRNMQAGVVILDKDFVVLQINGHARRIYPNATVERQAPWLAHDREKRSVVNKAQATSYIQFDIDNEVTDESGKTFFAAYIPLTDDKDSSGKFAEILIPESFRDQMGKQIPQPAGAAEPIQQEVSEAAESVNENIEQAEPQAQETASEVSSNQTGGLYGLNIPDPDQVIQKSAIGAEEEKEDSSSKMKLGGMLNLKQGQSANRIERSDINLQDYARDQGKPAEAEVGPFGLVVTVREVMDASKRKYRDSHVTFALDNPQGNFAMTSNKKLVKSMLENIIDYSVGKVELGNVEVSLRSTLDHVKFGISFDAPMLNDREVQRIVDSHETGEVKASASNIEKASAVAKELNGILGVASKLNREILLNIKIPRNASDA